MKKKHETGFSLIELVVVLSMVAILTAIAVPGIRQMRYRDALVESTNDYQEGGVRARTLALQTRQAAVLEVRGDKIWVNLLSGAFCDSDLERRCMRGFNAAFSDGHAYIAPDGSLRETAGVAMCGGAGRTISGTGDGATCTETLFDTTGFALCYTGMGELYVRSGPDPAMECSGSSQEQTVTNWVRSCGSPEPVSVGFEDGSAYELHDGAMMVFNRYEHGYCGGEHDDVRRAVFFPSGGAPFNKVASVEEDSE